MAMLQHTLGVFINPDREWQRIRAERHSFVRVFLIHTPLLALIPVIAAYFGVTRVGWNIGDAGVVKLTHESALWLSVGAYIMQLIAVAVLGAFTSWVARTFGVSDTVEHRHYTGTALAVYSAIPMMLAGIVLLYPQIWVVTPIFVLAACYSVYLVYSGIPVLMNIPKERGFIYASSVVTVALVLVVVVLVATIIVWSSGFGPVYTN